MLDCVDQLSTPAAAAAAAMCSGLDVTDTTHERSGSTTVYLFFLSHYYNYTKKLFTVHQMLYKPYLKKGQK